MEEINVQTCYGGIGSAVKDFLTVEAFKEAVSYLPAIAFYCGDATQGEFSDDYMWELEFKNREKAFQQNNKDCYFLGKPAWR